MYAVVQYNNYGAPVHAYTFNDENAAQRRLEKEWWKFLSKEETESQIAVVPRESFVEDNYAVVSWANGDKEEWEVVETEE